MTRNGATALMQAQAQAQAISGLGGIGKTQTALEYAYRYGHLYHYVLWVSAATPAALLADGVSFMADETRKGSGTPESSFQGEGKEARLFILKAVSLVGSL